MVASSAVWAVAAGSSGPAGTAPSAPSGPAGAARGACDLIPPTGGDVERIGPCEVYGGADLYEYIDGGAPQYLEYGFREVVSQEIRYRGRGYILDVYRMADPVAAFGIFSTRRPDLPTTLPGLPRSCFAGYQGLVTQGALYVEIQADENSDSTAIDMGALASLVFANARVDPAHGKEAIDSLLAYLPSGGRLAGSERIARGPVSLGAALGLTAGGSFLRVVEAVEKAVEAAGPREAILWLVSGYHPGATSRSPRTTLACLVRVGDPGGLLPAIREAGHVAADAEPLAGGAGWIVPATNGKRWLVAARGADLWLAVSTLPADSLRLWLSQPRP